MCAPLTPDDPDYAAANWTWRILGQLGFFSNAIVGDPNCIVNDRKIAPLHPLMGNNPSLGDTIMHSNEILLPSVGAD